MTNDNNKPGADAPGEKKRFVRRPAEVSNVASAPAESNAPRTTAILQKRQAEAVVDPLIDDTSARSPSQTLISVLPPEAVVRLVLFAGRIARRQGKRLPPNIEERLGEALARGDAAAPTLRDWAVRIGVLDDGPSLTPAGSRDTDPVLAGGDRVTNHDRAVMRAVSLARQLRERLGMNRPTLLAKAELGKRPVSLAARVSDSGDASPTVSDDTGRRS